MINSLKLILEKIVSLTDFKELFKYSIFGKTDFHSFLYISMNILNEK